MQDMFRSFDWRGKTPAPDGEVAVSIFVNPLQFEPGSDFSRYPRPESADEEICRAEGVDLIFRPLPNEMYFAEITRPSSKKPRSPRGSAARRGRVTFAASVPWSRSCFISSHRTAAVFGEKDFQQLAIIRRMVRDLDFPVEIVAGPTVREAGWSRAQLAQSISQRGGTSAGADHPAALCLRRRSRRKNPPQITRGGAARKSSRLRSPGLITPRSWAPTICNRA